MEERILKELENINGQLKGMDQRFEKIDQKFEDIKSEIITTLRDEFDQKLETTENRIVTTLRKELDERLKKSEEKISKDVSDSIKDLCDSITRVEDGKHDEIITLLKIHEKRDAQRIESIKRAFVS